jgi:hypothetical protein
VTGPSGPAYLEYGGLTSVPGPFHCSDAHIVVTPLKADRDRLVELCSTVLAGPDGSSSFGPVGEFVLLSFGSMVVRSMSPDRSAFYGIPYADMGASTEQHVAVWIPVVSGHGDGAVEAIDQFAVFIPAMWVDNPVSLLGGREIYGIAKQWGEVTIGEDHSCSLTVVGGDFGPGAMSGPTTLFDITPRSDIHPVQAIRDVTDEAGRILAHGLKALLHGKVELPDRALMAEAERALANHELHEIAVRQFRTPPADGAAGSPPELVGITSRFSTVVPSLLDHGFDVVVHPLDSHPLLASLGIASQTTAIGIEVTADFILAAD